MVAMALSRRTCLLLAGLGGGAVAAECQGNATCQGQLEDESLMQLGRLGLRAGLPGARRGFAQNSKPFLAKGKWLNQAQEGRLLINEDGVEHTYYLPGATTLDGGKTVKYLPPFRFYLMKTPTTDYSNRDNFYMPILPGKTFSVDIDFRRDGPGCGCNLNFYMVGMPWHTAGKDHDYYCDAQCFPGLGCCYEFDMNEGNKEVQQITNHACTRNYPSHPDWQCNKWGDPELKTHPSDFAPGSGHTIDSNRPFTYSQRFDVNGDDFTFTTTLSQDGRSLVLRMGPGSGELNAMLGELRKGMAFVTGYWYDASMNWMDGELCGEGPEHCNRNPAYISNWRITSNDGSSPQPGPGPSPPAPSPPAPGPASGGKCCWGAEGNICDNCKGPEDWCGQSFENCWVCEGAWCKA